MKVTDTGSAHAEWIRALSVFLGCPLRLVEGSETVDPAASAATLEGTLVPSHPGITVELIVKLLTTRMDDGEVAVWALVFFFIDKQRVAPPGQCCLAVEWHEGHWKQRRWESDEYGEWTELETLE